MTSLKRDYACCTLFVLMCFSLAVTQLDQDIIDMLAVAVQCKCVCCFVLRFGFIFCFSSFFFSVCVYFSFVRKKLQQLFFIYIEFICVLMVVAFIIPNKMFFFAPHFYFIASFSHIWSKSMIEREKMKSERNGIEIQYANIEWNENALLFL